MKNLIFKGGLALMTIALLSGCAGSSDLIARQRRGPLKPSEKMKTVSGSATSVRGIKVSNTVKVIYTQSTSDNASYELKYPENYDKYMEVKKSGGVLSVGLKGDVIMTEDINELVITLKLTTPALREVDMSGATSFMAENLDMTGSEVEFDLSGASKVSLNSLNAGKLEIDMSGASSFEVSTVEVTGGNVEYEISGASHVNVEKLKTGVLSAEVSGASHFNISKSIVNIADFEVSGASHMQLEGLDASKVKCEVSGASHAGISGKAKDGIFSTSGTSNLDISKLKVATISKESSGMSSIND